MPYMTSIKTALLIFPLVAFLITVPFILHQYHKYGSINKLRVLIIYSFILYLMTVYFLVILPLPSIEEVENMETIKPILIPFTFIRDIITETSFRWNKPITYLKFFTDRCVYTVMFNILMTVPFGMYLRYYFKCSFKKTLIYSFLLSLFFELTQLTGLYFIYPKAYRVFDVDDLLVNTLGGILGYKIMSKIHILPTREDIDESTYKSAQTVSGLRRITIFFIDFFIFIILDVIMNSIFRYDITKYVTFILYYGLIPYLFDGKTLGSRFVHVRYEFDKRNILKYIFKAFVEYMYYIFIPFDLIIFTRYIPISSEAHVMIVLILLLLEGIYYFISVIKLLKNNHLFYEKLTKVKFVNTIKSTKN